MTKTTKEYIRTFYIIKVVTGRSIEEKKKNKINKLIEAVKKIYFLYMCDFMRSIECTN